MKHIFIINPISGHHNAIELIPSIEEYFKDRPHDFAIHLTQYPKHATQLAAQYSVDDDVTIYSCGGDGTIHEIVNGLAIGVPLAILPVGTGNDFFTMLDTKLNSIKELLVDTIEGKEVWVDAGRCNNSKFANVVSIGFDADIGYDANKLSRIKMLPSRFVYLTSVFKNLGRRKVRRLTLEFDNKTMTKDLLLVAIMNSRRYGGGFTPTPMADIQDGLFDICIIRNTSLLTLLRLLPKYVNGTHLDADIVEIYHTNAIRVSCDELVNVQSDGEVSKEKAIDVMLLNKGLKLRVPLDSKLKENL